MSSPPVRHHEGFKDITITDNHEALSPREAAQQCGKRVSFKENWRNRAERRKMGPLGFATGTEWLPGPLESPPVNVGQRPAPSVPEEVGEASRTSQGQPLPLPWEGPFSSWNPLICIGSYSSPAELTCTVIRLCRVWLGPGFSSQKFSVT